jgi:hypothetical protein
MSRITWIVTALLVAMGALMAYSAYKDTPTTDENLMIGVGHLILKEQYFKVGFEHPPFVRDLVAIPLLFLDLKPASTFLKEQGQQNLSDFAFNFGESFLLNQSAPLETILFASRVSAILLTLLLGFLIFKFTFKQFGLPVAITSLLLFISSPFFLAHGRLTTMDVPTALAAFAVLWMLSYLLQKQTVARALSFGLILALALLTKFPMASLLPFLIVIYFTHALIFKNKITIYLKNFLIAFVSSFFVIYVFYWFHLINYPQSEHIADMLSNIQATRAMQADRMLWIVELAKTEFLRPIAHYLYGMFWQMVRGGAFGYFWGHGSYTSWWSFYPFGFVAKNPEPLIILFLCAMFQAFKTLIARRKSFNFVEVLKLNWVPFILLLWVLYYLFVLIVLNSGNTGSRYLMPILPAVFILISLMIFKIKDQLNQNTQKYFKFILATLIALNFVSVYCNHPHYLSYFSYFFGGPSKASLYLVDTDVEWGQDIQRLSDWVQRKDIKKITVVTGFDYLNRKGNTVPFFFSDGVYRYFLKERYLPYDLNAQPSGWFAVPGRLLRWGQARPSSRDGWSSTRFDFLKDKEPVEIIGGSIWIYFL